MSVIAVHTAWRAESLYIIYSSGSSSWSHQNQILWFNRNTSR